MYLKLSRVTKAAKETEQDLLNQLNNSHSFDPLTGVYTQHHFMEHAEQEIDRIRRYGKFLSLMRINIDHLQKINQDFGNKAVDLAIKTFCQTASRITRSLDYIGRWGDSDFIILLPNTPKDDAEKLAERLRIMVEQLTVSINQKSFSFTISGGIDIYKSEEDTLPGIIKNAESQLVKVQSEGGNRILTAEEPKEEEVED